MTKAEINADFIASLRHALGEGKHGLSAIPGLLKKIIQGDMWEEFYDEVERGVVLHATFESFITENPPKGLGSTIQQVRNMCRDDTEAIDAIDKATKRDVGTNQHSEGFDNIQGQAAPTGTSKAQALRRLRKDAPGVHARVIAGEISANAGMIEAGFRKKTATIEATPEGVVRYIMRHMTPFERLYIKDHT